MNPTQKVELLRAACCVAGIDGDTGPAELELVGKLAADVGVGKASLEAMLDRSRTDQEFYREQFRVLKADPTEAMSCLLRVAMADGDVTDDEVFVLQKLANNLEVPQSVFDELIVKVRSIVGGN